MLGRGALGECATVRVPTARGKLGSPGLCSGVGVQVGQSCKIAPKRTLPQSYFPRWLTVGSASRWGAPFLAWQPLAPLSHPLLLGAVAQRAARFLIHVYWASFRDRRRGPSAPPGAPAPPLLRAASAVLPRSLPAPHTSAPTPRPQSSQPHPVLHHPPLSFSLQLPRPSLAPPCCPLQKIPLFLYRRSLEVCSAPPSGTGGRWGGGRN